MVVGRDWDVEVAVFRAVVVLVVMITVMVVAGMGVMDGSGNDGGDGCYRWW